MTRERPDRLPSCGNVLVVPSSFYMGTEFARESIHAGFPHQADRDSSRNRHGGRLAECDPHASRSNTRRNQKTPLQSQDEGAYLSWIERYLRFDKIVAPLEAGEAEVERFLSYLANSREVAAATQNQALSAILFFYTDVLDRKLDRLGEMSRAKTPKRLPVVMTREEVRRVLARLRGAKWIAAMLMYGAGLRLLECLQLRVKDIDFGYHQITVRAGKGNRDLVTVFSRSAESRMHIHLEEIKRQFERDLKCGGGYVKLPQALARKYPDANRQ